MKRLQPLLATSGVPEEDMCQWTSHCFRRGSGVDMLEEQGVRAMVAHGGWANPRSAEPYASAEEQRAVSFAAAQHSIEDSEDDT